MQKLLLIHYRYLTWETLCISRDKAETEQTRPHKHSCCIHSQAAESKAQQQGTALCNDGVLKIASTKRTSTHQLTPSFTCAGRVDALEGVQGRISMRLRNLGEAPGGSF